MGGEALAAAAVSEADRYRAGQDYHNPLAGNPAGGPDIATTVKAADGSSVEVANPTATRVALACMNMNAVMGGAAWGAHQPTLRSCRQSTVSCRESDWISSLL